METRFLEIANNESTDGPSAAKTITEAEELSGGGIVRPLGETLIDSGLGRMVTSLAAAGVSTWPDFIEMLSIHEAPLPTTLEFGNLEPKVLVRS